MSRVAIICSTPPLPLFSWWESRMLALPVMWFSASQKGTMARHLVVVVTKDEGVGGNSCSGPTIQVPTRCFTLGKNFEVSVLFDEWLCNILPRQLHLSWRIRGHLHLTLHLV
mmetsp:Transcript_18707/g.52573  ORF Transcript_18707/g.52573 Transcript_18707/m.52573 type:complete len:112 (-) Transcript_18707:519-854(-)